MDKRDNLYHERGFRLVEKKVLEEIRKTLSSGTEPSFDCYVLAPEESYTTIRGHPKGKQMLHMFSNFVERSNVDHRKIEFTQVFREKIETSLSDTKYETIESGTQIDSTIMDRTGKHLEFLMKNQQHPINTNYFINNVGVGTFIYDSQIEKENGSGKIKVESGLYTVVAKKI